MNLVSLQKFTVYKIHTFYGLWSPHGRSLRLVQSSTELNTTTCDRVAHTYLGPCWRMPDQDWNPLRGGRGPKGGSTPPPEDLCPSSVSLLPPPRSGGGGHSAQERGEQTRYRSSPHPDLRECQLSRTLISLTFPNPPRPGMLWWKCKLWKIEKKGKKKKTNCTS